MPFYADKLDDNTGEESDTDDERNMLKIDSILDNFIGNFNESKPSVDQSKERDLIKLLNSLNKIEKDML